MSSETINLLIGVHCHQPVSNFGWVFEQAYEKAYRPFLSALEKHPEIKVTLHYSGGLLEWIEKNRPVFLERLKSLVKSGQAEMMTGGYYEPILPLIPDWDKTGQIKMLSETITSKFSCEPSGLWLAERIWEPHLPIVLSNCGVKYTVVDDEHFFNAGLSEDEVFGYFITEESGHRVSLFPSSKKLRYLTPFKPAEETIAYLRSIATSSGTRCAVIADDGEKFGLWPGTHKWVYEEGWLETFLDAISRNSSWIRTMTFSGYLEKYPAAGRIYIPCASYAEMMEWSGGYFRNFLVKYPEANNMHKRSLELSRRIHAVASREENAPESDTSPARRATISLYRAQTNCAYWHGLFGGLYLHHLRDGVYSNLIDAEKTIDRIENTFSNWIDTRVDDVDCDGLDEIVIRSEYLNLYIDGHAGGSLYELDYRPRSVNLVNTLTRRREHYHGKLLASADPRTPQNAVASIHERFSTKQDNLHEFLHYDWYRKVCFLDHVLPKEVTDEDLLKAKNTEIIDLVSANYVERIERARGRAIVRLSADSPLSVSKTFTIRANSPEIDVLYEVKNRTGERLDCLFGPELNLSLMQKELAAVGRLDGLKSFEVRDEWYKLKVLIEFEQNFSCVHFPIETVSGSEEGLEKTYQGMSLFFLWPLSLEPDQNWKQKGRISIHT